MDEMRRRSFCTMAAAAGGLLAGCNSIMSSSQDPNATSRGTIVTTRRELESAFENLSQGDTIYISEKNAPYRTTSWLDIDVDGVTVIGPGVTTLIKPADEANVGGIRIGKHQRCREIDVRGVGFHGNPDGQATSATRLHGIDVRNARNVTITQNRLRQTHPRRHGDGGSGISVAQSCTGVRIFDNHIDKYGDRGIQIGGTQHAVFSNVITTGLDRPISCDLWYSKQKTRTAQSVSIFGNLLGDSFEGSLIGVAQHEPIGSNEGFVSIIGNVGFGSHKSFCHLRGPAALQNISVQNNVSLQETDRLRTEKTTKYAGILIDVDKGRNLSIRNNELTNYSGHGIRVKSTVAGLSVQQNNVFRPSLAGVLIDGGTDGLISGNLIVKTGEAGIRLTGTANLAVSGNYIRRAGTAGIVDEGSTSGMSTDIAGNHITANSQKEGRSAPGILVRDTGVGVHGNVLKRHGGPAIAEGAEAGNNVFVDNRSDGDEAWRIRSPTSVVRGHTPSVDVHRSMTTGPGSNTVSIAFERPYARPPRLTFGRTGSGIRNRSFMTDDEGNIVGVTITTRNTGETVDVFVDDV